MLFVGEVRCQPAFDRLAEALAWNSADGQRRARVSGLLDLEAYAFQLPAPGLIASERDTLLNPRLTVFLDAQWGESLYAFGQARLDRGFDPGERSIEGRLDEFAVRWSPAGRREFTVQLGKFATVVGNWTARHDSWRNPFITAPLAYEQLTGLWDNEPPNSLSQLLFWSHVRAGPRPVSETHVRVPVLWGASYTLGAAAAGSVGRFRYALEVKNASLSSRPAAWELHQASWRHPTISGRLRYVPDPRWEFGWSASAGSYLLPEAAAFIPSGHGRGDYRQIVVGQDVTFAWRHLQLWAEVYACRFEVPTVGDAELVSYYVEAKYKLGPRWFAAARWNQQLFGRMAERSMEHRWGRNAWRIDLAPTFRLSANAQVKLQYSLQEGDHDRGGLTHFVAAQATMRF